MKTGTHDPKSQLIFYAGMYDETLTLLVDAQEYFATEGRQEARELSPVEKMIFTSEMSRITLRLSSVMAWLLARKAVCAGEISQEESVERFRLCFDDICMQEIPEMHYLMPDIMCDLMTKSLSLYRRAHRLDTQIAEEFGGSDSKKPTLH